MQQNPLNVTTTTKYISARRPKISNYIIAPNNRDNQIPGYSVIFKKVKEMTE